MAFRGIQTNYVTTDQIVDEMVKYVRKLKDDSPHLKHIEGANGNRENFEFNLGQRSCVFGTIEMIVERLCKEFSDDSEILAVPTPTKTPIPDPVFDIKNLQTIVDNKLCEGLKNHGYDIQHFTIIDSQTETFPYKIYVECPNCIKRIAINITADVKRVRKVANFRRYSFINHYLKCMGDQQIISYDIKMEDIDPIS